MKTGVFVFFSSIVLLALCGCGSGQVDCSLKGIHIEPTTATADHAAAAPGNAVQFTAIDDFHSGCAVATVIRYDKTWTVSDPVHASISNAHDATYGTATCTGAALAPITVAASTTLNTGQIFSATASLTCK